LLLSAITALFLSTPQISTAQTLELVGPLRMADSPLGLAVADYVGGKIVIADPATMAVTDAFSIYSNELSLDINGDPVFDVNGDPVFQAGKPLSVGWMNGRLYVGEERTGLIQVFEKTGGKKSSGNKNPKKQAIWVQVSASLTASPVPQPSAIVADEARGWLFIASKIDGVVYVVDETGTLVKTIGDANSAAPLGQPQAIALDRDSSRVFVSDDGIEACSWSGCSYSSAIQIYDYDGLLLGTIDGSNGNAGYRFSRAQGVALDSAGHVYLADSFRHEVMVFEELTPNSFSALGLLGGKGAAPGQLLLPTGVLIDAASSRTFVANTMLSRIEVFGMEDLTP
jgi:DNA-binding beta-propeller fold protein YncE